MSIYNQNDAANYASVALGFSADTGSLSAWVYHEATSPYSWKCPFDLRTTDDGVSIYSGVNAAAMHWGLWDNPAADFNGSTPSASVWYHVGLIADASNLTLYIDGALEVQISSNNTWDSIRIGSNLLYDEPANLRCAGMKAWDATLTLAEMHNEMHTLHPKRTTDMLGYWPMFPGSSERLRDYSGNGNDLTETGTLLDRDPPPISWGAHTSIPTIYSGQAAARIPRNPFYMYQVPAIV